MAIPISQFLPPPPFPLVSIHLFSISVSLFLLCKWTWIEFSRILEKEMATHSSVLAWRIPGTGEPGRLPSMGSQRIGHDWSDLAAAEWNTLAEESGFLTQPQEKNIQKLPKKKKSSQFPNSPSRAPGSQTGNLEKQVLIYERVSVIII